MTRPATTKPTLENEFAGCLTQPSRAASQKFAPRPTSGPSQPAPTATTSSAVDTTATAPAQASGRSERSGTGDNIGVSVGSATVPVLSAYSVGHGAAVTDSITPGLAR